jgi:hypothetical protein
VIKAAFEIVNTGLEVGDTARICLWFGGTGATRLAENGGPGEVGETTSSTGGTRILDQFVFGIADAEHDNAHARLKNGHDASK